jgi:hypothetical protein
MDFKSLFLAIIRQAIQFGAGVLVAKGLVEASMIDTIVGGFVSIANAVWMIFAKKADAKK